MKTAVRAPFPGFGLRLTRFSAAGRALNLRFSVDFYPPEPGVDPIYCVQVDDPVRADAALSALAVIAPADMPAYPRLPSETQFLLEFDHSDPILIEGARVVVTSGGFEPEDLQRFVEQHAAQFEATDQQLREAHRRLDETQRLLIEQEGRVLAKRHGHAEGTTARTLYDQQVSFIRRLQRIVSERP